MEFWYVPLGMGEIGEGFVGDCVTAAIQCGHSANVSSPSRAGRQSWKRETSGMVYVWFASIRKKAYLFVWAMP